MGLNGLCDISGRRLKSLLPAAVVLLMLALAFRQASRVDYRWHWSPEERVGLWIRGISPPGPRVVSRKGWVAFYAGGERIPLPLTYEALLECARESRADYFVFRKSRLERKRKGMLEKIDPDDMELVHRVMDGEDAIFVYQFKSKENKNNQ